MFNASGRISQRKRLREPMQAVAWRHAAACVTACGRKRKKRGDIYSRVCSSMRRFRISSVF